MEKSTVYRTSVHSNSMKLTSTRLTLEPVSMDTFEEIYSIITNEFVRKFLFDDQILSKDEVASLLKTSYELFQENRYGLWTIRIAGKKKLAGLVGLWHFHEEPFPQLLYALSPEYTGKGYALEASQLVINYAFSCLDFPHVDASCDTANVASTKTALAIGMSNIVKNNIDAKDVSHYRINRTTN